MPFLPIIIFAALALLLVLYNQYRQRLRQQAVRALAASLGIEVTAALQPQDFEIFQNFEIAKRGRGRVSNNAMVADSGPLRVVVFDHKFTVGSGKQAHTYRQTIAMVSSQSINTPHFTLAPEGFWHRVGEFFGFKDINFETDPEFSKTFQLKGPDVGAIRDFMTSSRRSQLLQFSGFNLESLGSNFILYRSKRVLDTDAFQALMSQCLTLNEVLEDPESDNID
ncbi:MAG: hypothetical protein KDB03_08345 [Planctomycetales bacterium]|nr:hypothetical protein [Planctomycetales bacterium]